MGKGEQGTGDEKQETGGRNREKGMRNGISEGKEQMRMEKEERRETETRRKKERGKAKGIEAASPPLVILTQTLDLYPMSLPLRPSPLYISQYLLLNYSLLHS